MYVSVWLNAWFNQMRTMRKKEMVGMAMSISIVILELDKRNGLMSLLESRNDMVRHDRQ
jgi:hypothetical protein